MDRRTQRTKTALREALFACMQEKPLADITITEICATAGMNRTTFYKHYKLAEDIIREFEREQLEDMKSFLETTEKNGKDLMMEIMQRLERVKELRRLENGSLFSYAFRADMITMMKQHWLDAWRNQISKDATAEAELALETLIAGALHLYMEEKNRYSREMIAKAIAEMTDCCQKLYL